MKVCTDACIFGAWYASKMETGHPDAKLGLDIGSGTGLLMLMMAQKSTAEIHGVEIGETCYQQLRRNLANSPWSQRLQAVNADVRNHAYAGKYDFIISNPPFYDNDLSSPHEAKQLAMHSKQLNLEELVSITADYLSPGGNAGILLPYHRAGRFEKFAALRGLYKSEALIIKQTPKHDWFRSIGIYSFSQTETVRTSELTIKDESGNYTPGFIDLLKPYYLHL